jgi:hypothetical protein
MNTLELNSAKTLKIVIKESNKSARIQRIKKNIIKNVDHGEG